MASDTTQLDTRRSDIRPLENRTLWERVHEYLREEILSDRLPPGAELQEVALAEKLGVSRGPIREALGRLSTEGLVMIRPRNGAVVRSFSREEFIEAYQVREALETFALRLAVPRITAGDLAGLEALIEQMVRDAQSQDADGFFRTNSAFHEALVAASGNRKLGEVHRQLDGQIGRYRMRSLALRGNLQQSITEHREILAAIKARDTERAIALLSEHIHIPLRRLESASREELDHLGLTELETT